MLKNKTLTLAALASLLTARAALAHPGHDASGLTAGIFHPLTGVDHLAAMVAVGLWASQLGKKAMLQLPLAFVAMMAAGMGLALTGIHIPASEQAIAASVLVLGLLIVFAFKMPTWAGILLVGTFAIFHGWAHGNEMQSGISSYTFGLGMMVATAALLLAGAATGLFLAQIRQQKLVRFAGAMVILCAILIMTGAL